MSKDKNITKNHSLWVSGEYTLWLIENSGRPINLYLRKAENLSIRFDGSEWAQIFYEVLGCPTADEYLPSEDIEVWQKRNERNFREAISDFPMLGELNDIYSKILFNQKQIRELRSEILEAIPKAIDNKIALQGLMKLKEGCEKALEKKKFLFFN